jgi:hypothetical protein
MGSLFQALRQTVSGGSKAESHAAPDRGSLERVAIRRALAQLSNARDGRLTDEALNIAMSLQRMGFYEELPGPTLRKHVAAAMIRSRGRRANGRHGDMAMNLQLFLHRSLNASGTLVS